MNNISDAADLLATAREALTHELLPLLPKERRYVGLMIGSVIGIAARELSAGPVAMASEAGRATKLLAAHGIPLSLDADADTDADASAQALPALRRTLSAAIRAGRFDAPPANTALMAHLARTAADWVAISNPKALRVK